MYINVFSISSVLNKIVVANFIKILAIILCSSFTQPGLAQQNNTQPAPITIGVQLGLVTYGPGHSVYHHMERSGFGEAGGFFSADYPNRIQLAGKAEVTYSLNTLLGIKGSVFFLNGRVVGHDSFRRWVTHMNVISPAVLGFMQTRNEVFYLGAGPSLNFVQFKSKSLDQNTLKDDFQKVGWVIESGFRFPAKSMFFADVQMRYAYVGQRTAGPFRFQGQNFWSALIGANAPDRTVAAFEIPYNYFSINLGGGIRLSKLMEKY